MPEVRLGAEIFRDSTQVGELLIRAVRSGDHLGAVMKLTDLFKPKPQVGWQGQGGSPSPVLIGALVALVMAGGYIALVMFGHKG